jgi:phospholipid-binding lipoprotein MlaA
LKFLAAPLLVLLLTFSVPAWSDTIDDFHDPFEEVGSVTADVADPLEKVNRASFWFNDKIYRYLLSPLCQSVSAKVREALCSKVATCLAPVRAAHAGIEFRFRDAGSEFGRLVLGTFLQILDGGAERGENPPDPERVLARAGVGPGPYLVIPVLGPSTVRDGVGKMASFYLESPAALLDDSPSESSLGETLEAYLTVSRFSLDPYLSVRNFFSQQHEKENRSFLLVSQDLGDGV